MTTRLRHGRQARLAEVGEARQLRLYAATALVRSTGLEAWVTARYLAGAGVGELVVETEAEKDAAHEVDRTVVVTRAERAVAENAMSNESLADTEEGSLPFEVEDEAARAVARGAYAALVSLRGLLRLGERAS